MARWLVYVLTLVICACILDACSSDLEETNPAYRDGVLYKRYHYFMSLIPGEPTGWDIELFKNTAAWKLAKAVYSQDTIAIAELCDHDTSLVSIKESKYGQTLLSWAVSNNRFFSARALLKAGADPNKPRDSGDTPLMEAVDKEATSNYVKLLLTYGGNANDTLKLSTSDVISVLQSAAATNFESTRLLVEAGADVNYTSDGVNTAFTSAFIFGSMETAAYLISKGANYKKPVIQDEHLTLYGIDCIKNALKEGKPPQGTKEYEKRMQMLQFLREHGCDSTIKD